ncbi:MAG TPA: phosphatidate cytidylyltransferase [Smithellaceae bacterium]|nr:phosphatidate cytidylyltransferase [Smithellaceae bacterium]
MVNPYVKRWLTGLILAAVIFAVIVFCSPLVLALVISLCAVGGIWEYNHIVFGNGFLKEKIEGVIFAAIIPFIMLSNNSQLILAVLAFCILVTFIVFLGSVQKTDFDISTVIKVVFGCMYIPFLISHFILLRNLDKGVLWVLFVLVLAFAGDITALYVGKYFGKHKLIPLVSPGKTVEGTIGLIGGSTAACLIFGYFSFFPDVSLVKIGVLAFVGSIIGQLGDLSESAIKRNYGLKDASSLLPGHGGLLDRMDCLIFIAPFVYYYRVYVIG